MGLEVHDPIRVLLTICAALSFFPQIQQIRSQRSSAGIAIFYLLFNLISATEHFAIFFFVLVNLDHSHGTKSLDHLINSPPTAGDWLNLCQVTVVWIMFLILTCFVVYYALSHPSLIKDVTVIIYTVFLIISVVPEFLDAVTPVFRNEAREYVVMFFGLVHLKFIHPATTILSALSVFWQAYQIVRGPLGVLSVSGLAAQAMMFAVVGLSWFGHINFGSGPLPLSGWYGLYGWPIVDDLIFAGVQVALLLLVLYKKRAAARNPPMDESGEAGVPLLEQHQSI
ncbi:hypothetical protein BJY04DRAFT_216461 [Aspergillus karnatakaensis]|uniref:uncharacterized protein n=1 Tax=Aspergillus karnatakaensis TaxID=1810916 RepID=UPI003CCE301B